jgi:hypothetical protein
MPYSQRFVVTVLVNGVIQREKPDGSVEIPFGVEYVLRFRNKHDRRAVVKLWIDGEEQSKGGYVIPARSFKDIERNSHSPYKFKLVDSGSAESEAYGKDTENVEGYNGVIEARFYLEKEQPVVKEVHHHHHHDHYPPRPWPRWPVYPHDGYRTMSAGGPSGQSAGGVDSSKDIESYGAAASLDCNSVEAAPMSFAMEAAPVSAKRAVRSRSVKAGVTVEGGLSDVTYQAVHIDLEEQFTPIKVILKGYQVGSRVEEVVETCDHEVDEAVSKKA